METSAFYWFRSFCWTVAIFLLFRNFFLFNGRSLVRFVVVVVAVVVVVYGSLVSLEGARSNDKESRRKMRSELGHFPWIPFGST